MIIEKVILQCIRKNTLYIRTDHLPDTSISLGFEYNRDGEEILLVFFTTSDEYYVRKYDKMVYLGLLYEVDIEISGLGTDKYKIDVLDIREIEMPVDDEPKTKKKK